MDFAGFGWISWISGVRGFPACGSLWRPVAACGVRWRPLGTGSFPLKKVYGALEVWIMHAWRLGGLETWSLIALAEAGGLEARGFEAGPVF